MKRDLDLIRLLLINLEGEEQVDLSGYTQDQIDYHKALLIDAGLLEGSTHYSSGGGKKSHEIPDKVFIKRLSLQGHEFLNKYKDQTIWKKEKSMNNISLTDLRGNNTKIMGDEINIKAGGDVAFGKDEAIIVTINKAISEASNMPDDLQVKLKELTASVEEMIKGMSGKEAKKVTTNLDILVNQAKEEEPQAALCQVSANGLIEAAKTIGAIAQPVITTVKAILTLLIP